MIEFKNSLPGSVVPYRQQLFVACQAKTDATSFGALSVQNCCSISVVGGALKWNRWLSGAATLHPNSGLER